MAYRDAFDIVAETIETGGIVDVGNSQTWLTLDRVRDQVCGGWLVWSSRQGSSESSKATDERKDAIELHGCSWYEVREQARKAASTLM